jgi:hypothetical protein
MSGAAHADETGAIAADTPAIAVAAALHMTQAGLGGSLFGASSTGTAMTPCTVQITCTDSAGGARSWPANGQQRCMSIASAARTLTRLS